MSKIVDKSASMCKQTSYRSHYTSKVSMHYLVKFISFKACTNWKHNSGDKWRWVDRGQVVLKLRYTGLMLKELFTVGLL